MINLYAGVLRKRSVNNRVYSGEAVAAGGCSQNDHLSACAIVFWATRARASFRTVINVKGKHYVHAVYGRHAGCDISGWGGIVAVVGCRSRRQCRVREILICTWSRQAYILYVCTSFAKGWLMILHQVRRAGFDIGRVFRCCEMKSVQLFLSFDRFIQLALILNLRSIRVLLCDLKLLRDSVFLNRKCSADETLNSRFVGLQILNNCPSRQELNKQAKSGDGEPDLKRCILSSPTQFVVFVWLFQWLTTGLHDHARSNGFCDNNKSNTRTHSHRQHQFARMQCFFV